MGRDGGIGEGGECQRWGGRRKTEARAKLRKEGKLEHKNIRKE